MDFQDTRLGSAADDSFNPTTTAANEREAHVQDASSESDEEYQAYLSLLGDIPAVSYDLKTNELKHMPGGSSESGWQNCLNSVEKYDRELCQAYREQIDTLLVFAGLFSAVVTAFAIESYQWLQDDPVDASVELLRDMVGLLSQNLNITVPPTPPVSHSISGPAVARINSFWFLSLMLSLSAALVGILCKQWLREFERNVGQSPETALAVRFIRFQGLEYWKVGSIVTTVPIIMQMALAFFIIGIIDLLWRLHVVVACCVTVVAGLTLTFYLATTLLPAMQYVYICMRCYAKPFRARDYQHLRAFTEPQCAFKSAQAWLAFRIARPVLNRLLTAYGYRFSSQHPPAYSDPILRHADSWVTFDLNWVKCRENVHIGPRCAFESVTWIARNLEEMHMSSWIWHCVWACWLKNNDFPNHIILATRDIESVSRSYPRVVALGGNNTMFIRLQARIFQCSLRADFPIDTALELLLCVSSEAGVNSRWTREALDAIRIVYRGANIRLSDDIATGLFRLAEQQTHTMIYKPHGPNSSTQSNGAGSFRDIVDILQRGTHLRDRFMPAMSGLVLQWLRSRPPRAIGHVARTVFEDMIRYLVTQGYRGAGLHGLRHYRGVMFFADLAGAVAERWPDEPDLYANDPDGLAVLLELLAIFSDRYPGNSRDHFGSGEGERSSPPRPDAHLDPQANEDAQPRLDPTDVESQRPPPVHLCIEVHAEAQTDLDLGTEVAASSPAPPMASPVTPASPARNPMSPSSSGH